MSEAQTSSAPKAAQVRDSDVYLGDSLVELVASVEGLRVRLAPFLVPGTDTERPMNDAEIPARSALEGRLVWLIGQIAGAEEIIADINTRLYIPSTIDSPPAKKKMAS